MKTIQATFPDYLPAATSDTSRPGDETPRPWSPARLFATRALVLYFVFYVLDGPMINTALPGNLGIAGVLSAPIDFVISLLVPWTGLHVFGLRTLVGGGFGADDGQRAWLECLVLLVLALVCAAVWTARRPRVSGAPEFAWGRAILRYAVAMTMVTYGAMKVFQIQFGVLPLQHLMTPAGEMSPAALMWTFMESSYGYRVFVGTAELLGGLLLLSRRTTTLGALLVIAVMSNVVAMDVFYDVPVKLLSSHLVLMSLFLAAPDLRRLADSFLLNRPTHPARIEPLPGTRRYPRAAKAVAAVYAVAAVSAICVGNRNLWVRNQDRPDSPLTGIYAVESFTRNGRSLHEWGDTLRWDRVAIEPSGFLTARLPGERVASYLTKLDRDGRRMAVVVPQAPLEPRFWFANYQKRMLSDAVDSVPDTDATRRFTLMVARPDTSRIRIAGLLAGDTIDVLLRRLGPSTLLLQHWGTHFVYKLHFSDTWVAAPFADWPVRTPDRPFQ